MEGDSLGWWEYYVYDTEGNALRTYVIDRERGNVRELRHACYGAWGWLRRETHVDDPADDDARSDVITYKYDDQGLLIRKNTDYGHDGHLEMATYYEYSPTDQLIHERTVHLDGLQIEENIAYHYDEAGNLVREVRDFESRSHESSNTIRHSYEGELRVETTDGDKTTRFIYDEAGRLVREEPITGGRQFGYYTQIFDELGRRVQRIYHVLDKGHESVTRYRYGAQCVPLPPAVEPLEMAARARFRPR